MCGLVGFVSLKTGHHNGIGQQKKHFIHNGLYVSAFRGRDATGLALVKKPHVSPIVHKKALPAQDYLDLKSTDRVLNDVDMSIAVLGHTRSATRGWVSDENAHPFQSKNITLIHNGSVTNQNYLGSIIESDVDSAHVCSAMAEKGSTEVLEKVNGEYAFVWHDAKEGTINIARNGGRTLFWAEIPEWEGIVFASEQEFLGLLLGRNNIKLSKRGFMYPAEHQIHSFNLLRGLEFSSRPFVPRSVRLASTRTSTIKELRDWKDSHSERNEDSAAKAGGDTTTEIWLEQAERARLRISKLSPKHTKHLCRPTTQRMLQRMSKRTIENGIKFDTVHGCRPIVFCDYKGQSDWGCGCVQMAGHNIKYKDAEIHNIDKDIYDAIKTRASIHAHVVGVRTHNGKPIWILELHAGFLKATLDDYRRDHRNKEKIVEMVPGPGGVHISVNQWRHLTKVGCVYCTSDLDITKPREIAWTAQDEPVCKACAAEPEVLEFLSKFGHAE